jgi:hypothetical protein
VHKYLGAQPWGGSGSRRSTCTTFGTDWPFVQRQDSGLWKRPGGRRAPNAKTWQSTQAHAAQRAPAREPVSVWTPEYAKIFHKSERTWTSSAVNRDRGY